ncbi:MAG TPA: hypothetical protein PLE61_05370 [Vicinamibacterales bacterium]|nr:hypothetical protein [Vicinamibacterales bacterium]HOG29748.1 hypothetical protein [Vicinamibacterales bacterium]HOQ60031.1 hypothetical protein [Vicinamibacterales bacterium]HPW20226.1 hypothetical protein [Vicinamibacterales bacterium]
MGRLLRLAVAFAVAWAAWHAGWAAWNQFRFSSDVDEIAKFGPEQDERAVRGAVLEAAAKYGLPVEERAVRIRRQDAPAHLYIDVDYTVPIEVLPRVTYPWTFATHAHGWFVPGGRAPVK